MENKNKLFVPLPLSALLKLAKIKGYEVLTPEQIVAKLIEEKLKQSES